MKQPQPATKHRRKYDEQFKRDALRMIDNGQSVRSVAQALGIAESQLHKWKRQFKQTRAVGEVDVAELTQRLRQVEMERDILKNVWLRRRVSSTELRNKVTEWSGCNKCIRLLFVRVFQP